MNHSIELTKMSESLGILLLFYFNLTQRVFGMHICTALHLQPEPPSTYPVKSPLTREGRHNRRSKYYLLPQIPSNDLDRNLPWL